jgi:hypothetical protein
MLTLKVLNSSGLKDYFLDANEKNNTSINNADTISNTGKISVLEKFASQNITSEEIQEKFREESASITLTEETPNANKTGKYVSIKKLAEEISERRYALRNLQNRLKATQKDTDENLNDSPFAKIEHFEDYNNEISVNYEPIEIKDEEDKESGEDSSGTSDTFFGDTNNYKPELIGDSKDSLRKIIPQAEATTDEILENAKKHGKTWIVRFLKFYKKREAEKKQKISEAVNTNAVNTDNVSNVVELIEAQEAKELEMLNQLNKMEKAMNSVIDRKTTENAKSEEGNFIEIDGSLVYFEADQTNIRHCPKTDSWRNYVMYN